MADKRYPILEEFAADDEASKKLSEQAADTIDQIFRDLRHNIITRVESPPVPPTLLSDTESLTVLIEAMRTSAQDTLAALTRAGYCLARK